MTLRWVSLLLVLAVLLSSACAANDRAVVGEGGAWKLLEGEHASVRMVRERVRIDVGRERYDVKATFVFRNEGPAVTVKMGFPETGSGDIQAPAYRTRSAYTGFVTTVDGRVTPARRVFVEGDDMFYVAHWVKEVRFAAGQERVITVSYTAPLGSSVAGRLATYAFTGQSWKGKVERSVLEVVSHVPGDRLASEGTRPTRTVRPGDWLYERTDWQAEEAVQVFIERKK